jgi:hypothetical protein
VISRPPLDVLPHPDRAAGDPVADRQSDRYTFVLGDYREVNRGGLLKSLE